MQDILLYKVWIIALSFIFLFAFERILSYAKMPIRSLYRIFKNLMFWPLNIALSLTFILPLSYLASENALWVRPEFLWGYGGLIFDILILDMALYFWHCALHEIPFFWRFHEVHHLDEHLDTTSAIRFHFGEIFFATLFRILVIVLLAIPFTSIIIFEIGVLVFTLFHHSNIKIYSRLENFLAKIMVTPSIHWVHHHVIRKDTDSNYGTIFSFWDILFGTRN